MFDPWSLAAVAVAFIGGFVLGRRTAWQRFMDTAEDIFAPRIEAELKQRDQQIRALRVAVVQEGHRIQQFAQACRPVLKGFGLNNVLDTFEAIGARLVACDDPSDPVPREPR